MRIVLKNAILQQIQSRTEDSFQELVDLVYLSSYGSDFTSMKQKKDQGCDGIVKGTCVLAVYGPEVHSIAKFQTKIKKDFTKYNEHWKSRYPDWLVVYNNRPTASMQKFVDRLKQGSTVIGIDHLITMIDDLPWHKTRRVAEQLGVCEDFLVNDVLGLILDDMLKTTPTTTEAPPYRKPRYIGEKIALNYSVDEVDTAKNLYEGSLAYFPNLEDLLRACDDAEQVALKSRVASHYLSFRGSFSSRFARMVELFAGRNKDDDLYLSCLRAVLLFYFERCTIGKRTKGEKDANS